jgi:hypothetical protein
MVINKTGQSLTSDVSLASFQPGANAQVYRYSSADLSAIVQEANQPVTASGFSATFQANSITLIIIPPGGGAVTGVSIDGPITGTVGTDHIFAATVGPLDASTPITYTWSPEPISGQGTSAAAYRWSTFGGKTITVTAVNAGGSAVDDHVIDIWEGVYLPLVFR